MILKGPEKSKLKKNTGDRRQENIVRNTGRSEGWGSQRPDGRWPQL